MSMKDNSSNMLVSESIVDELESIDAVIFDCDGVLVDITESVSYTHLTLPTILLV